MVKFKNAQTKMKNRLKNKIPKTRWKYMAAAFIMPALLMFSMSGAPQALASLEDELRNRSAQLEAEIEKNEEQAEELNAHGATLQKEVDQLNTDISQINKRIDLIDLRIDELTVELKETRIELERQKDMLRVNMRALYKRGGASTVELLVASDSFSQFIDEQEYLERLKAGIQESAEKVVKLEQKVRAQRDEQKDLKKEQEDQKQVLAAKQQRQRALLEETRGEEARYREMIARQQQELRDAEQKLAQLSDSGLLPSGGHVDDGRTIGLMGSTGASNGSHIHFMVKRNGNNVDPAGGRHIPPPHPYITASDWLDAGNSLINGFSWPVGGSKSGQRLTTPYGNINCITWQYPCSGNGWHSGLDISAPAKTAIKAAAGGELLIAGCQGGLGYTVIVKHGGGWETWYPHLTTPSGQIYGYC